MEEIPKKTIFEKLREIIPMVTPLLMFSAIAFTYFTYFFDISKTPQITIQNAITKLHETDEYYIIKLSLKIKNQSKTKVAIIANLGKLYGYRCTINELKNDSSFIEKIIDTLQSLNRLHKAEPFELHQNLNWHDERLIGFYQPIHNASWFLPEEIYTQEIVTAIPKSIDVVYYYFNIDYTDDERDIFSRYVRDRSGDPEYQLYTVNENDTITLRDLNIENEDSVINSVRVYKIYATGSQFVAWLNTNGTVNESTIKSDSANYFPGDEIKEEK